MSLLSHGMKLIKSAFSPKDGWEVRRETTLRESLMVFWSSLGPFIIALFIDDSHGWYELWMHCVIFGAYVLWVTRLIRLEKLWPEAGEILPEDHHLARRSKEEGHESAISFIAIFVSCLIVSVFKLLELASYRIFEFILTWW